MCGRQDEGKFTYRLSGFTPNFLSYPYSIHIAWRYITLVLDKGVIGCWTISCLTWIIGDSCQWSDNIYKVILISPTLVCGNWANCKIQPLSTNTGYFGESKTSYLMSSRQTFDESLKALCIVSRDLKTSNFTSHKASLVGLIQENVAYTGLSRRWASYGRSGDVLYGRSRDVLYGRSGGVSYGRRRWCLVWPEMTVDSDMGWWHSAVLHSHIYWPCGPVRYMTIKLLAVSKQQVMSPAIATI